MNVEAAVDELVPLLMEQLRGCPSCRMEGRSERGLNLAGQQAVRRVVDALVTILFPGCHGLGPMSQDAFETNLRDRLAATLGELTEQVKRAFEYQCRLKHCEDCGSCALRAVAAMEAFVHALPAARDILAEDIVAAFEGDPAAQSTMEVVMSYPGVYAVTVHRVAHILYDHEVPLIPRIMSEYAHAETGIDIHPGATIGPGFFIDHGTGVVIGETCVIGRRVKLYQGVTLGALSFEKDAEGNPVKGIKRHPNVEDHVVIYAGATLLGGNTTIGAGSVIGGNVWLTHSVPPGSKVHNQQPRPLIRQADGHWGPADAPWSDIGGGI